MTKHLKHINTSLWTRENLAWLAGILEGEGCFQSSQGMPIAIILGMTDFDVVEKVHKIAGCGNIQGPYKRKEERHKPLLRWKVSNAEHSYALLCAIHCFMGNRRIEKIEKCILEYKFSGAYLSIYDAWN